MEEINKFVGKYSFLSNLYNEKEFKYKGIFYTNAEAAFQAQKIKDEALKIKMSHLNGKWAKYVGDKIPVDKNWKNNEYNELCGVLYAKFIQNKNLQIKLLNTRGYFINDGTLDNKLGRALMHVREDINYITKL